MCGIAGVYPERPVPPGELERAVDAMCARMLARGPDAHGRVSLNEGGPVLGHRRLAIIDLDHRSDQPMQSADGRFTVVFNGEIYNYRELRQKLEASGVGFRTRGDTEVLLELYRQRGQGMFASLRGMFAFAIYDAVERSLVLARDPHGIKPLYFARTAAGLAFASQVKALLASRLVSTQPSAAGAAGFYLWGSVPEPWSMYRDVLALPAGHCLEVRRGVAGTPRAWYDIRERWREPARHCSSRELAARVKSAVRDSVRAHAVADVKVSVFLSGGIDSGAIAGLLSSQCARVEGITVGFAEFGGRRDDEVPVARAIAAQYGITHHVRRVGRAEFGADLPRILDAMDQPSIDGVNTWFASKAAAERGCKVVLSGVGGDELLCGYSSFRQLPRAHAVTRRALRVPGLAPLLTHVCVRLAERRQQPKLAGAIPLLGSLEGLYQLRRGLFLPAELPLLMGERAAREGLEALGEFAGQHATRARDDGAAVGLLESTLYLRNQLLRDSDWASMAHSLELRTPLVDTRLLEALAPYVAGFAHGRGKRWLARSPERPLARAIQRRPKTGFGLPMADWLAELGAHSAGLHGPAAPHAGAPLGARDERAGLGASPGLPEAYLGAPGVPWARRWARYLAARWSA
jgi:asparagine synthase (glutamine-hydrolysing)